MLSMLVGVVASGRRSSEPEEVTFAITVGESTGSVFTWRGGGVVGIEAAIAVGSLAPTAFSRGYEVSGIACMRLTPPKSPTEYYFEVFLSGPEPPGTLVAAVDGWASPLVVPYLGQTFWDGWRCAVKLPDSALFTNWAPGANRSVTLKWKD